MGPPATPTPPAPPPPDAAPLGVAPLYPCLGIVAGVFPDPPVPLGNAPPPPLPPGRPFTPGEAFPPDPPPVAVNPNAVEGLQFLCVPVVVGEFATEGPPAPTAIGYGVCVTGVFPNKNPPPPPPPEAPAVPGMIAPPPATTK